MDLQLIEETLDRQFSEVMNAIGILIEHEENDRELINEIAEIFQAEHDRNGKVDALLNSLKRYQLQKP